jgi:hypothetical protein
MEKNTKNNANNELNDFIFVGPRYDTSEIDKMFVELYEKLLDYSKSIFEVVDKLCPSCEDQIHLALNIAETDGKILPCIVAKECEKRKSLMNIEEEAKERFQPIQKKPIPIQDLHDIYMKPWMIAETG